jgi:glycosyltransferase involved in cell wall biosynthesis
VYGIRHATHIVTQTADQARLLEAHYGREADAVIPNFQPAPTERIDKTGPLSIVWVAGLKRWKQPEVFVRLARRLSDLRDARFIVVGSAPRSAGADREWASVLMREIDETPNLEYLGARGQSEVNELVARAHLLVNTSIAEGFPNTFIQAWMREVPVVSLHVDPDGILAREQIGVCAGTEANLARAVRIFAEDSAKRAEYGRRARRYAMRHHSLANVQLLRQLMDTGSSVEIEPRDVHAMEGDHGAEEMPSVGNDQ